MMLDTEPINQKALAGELGVADSSAGRLIDRLEKMGLVERRRDAVDRRAYGISLTDAGENRIKELLSVGQSFNEDLTSGISDEELALYEDVLMRMVDNVCNTKMD